MPNRLRQLHSDEVSHVTRAANRRRFLIKKGATMAIDEVKMAAFIEKADEAGLGDVLESLVADDEKTLSADEETALLKATGMTHAEYKKVRAAMKVMGKDLAKKFPQFAKVLAFDGDSEDQVDQGADDGDEADSEGTVDGKKTKRDKAQKGATGAGELSPEVVARLQKAEEDAEKNAKENAELRDRLQKMEDERERAVFVRKAAEFSAVPGAAADDLGAILWKTSKALTKAEQAKLEQILKAADAAIRTGVLKEIGSELSDQETKSASDELAAKVAELCKADATLTKAQATHRILKGDATLQARLNTESDQRVRKARGG